MIKQKFCAFDAILLMAGACALTMLILFMMLPGLDHGLAFGWDGFLISVAMTVVSAGVSALAWVLFFRKEHWKLKDMCSVAAIVLPTACLIFYGIFIMANHNFGLAEYLQQNKVEHFCLDKFKREECVVAVNSCPDCARRIDKWKRNQMAAKLNAYSRYFPEQLNSSRKPASEKP